MIIDFHTHVVPPAIKQDPGRYVGRDPCFDVLYAMPNTKLATAAELLESMDKSGVDVSVMLNIGWSSHRLCQESGDDLMEAVARHPRRLVGFAAVQPLAGDDALKEIERCEQGGLKGLGELRSDIQGYDLADRATLGPVVELARRLGFIWLSHASEPVGHIYPGKGRITPDALYSFITAFPDLKIVLAHWGGGLPFYALMPEVASALTNVYFDTAASPFLYRPAIYKQVAELVGDDKVLFGSDYPLLRQSRLIDEIRAQTLAREVTDKILGGNSRRLLDIR